MTSTCLLLLMSVFVGALGCPSTASAQTKKGEAPKTEAPKTQTTKREKPPPPRPGGSGAAAKYPEVYRLRLSLVEAGGGPVAEADITSSVGGEGMSVKAGGVYTIPSATVPKDRWVTVWAEKKSEDLRAEAKIQLKYDPNPNVIMRMEKDTSAFISGRVVNETGGDLAGAHVSVAGYPNEATITDKTGQFKLPAHRAKNRMVRLYVRMEGYENCDDWQLTGDEIVTVRLKRKQP